MGDAGRMRMLGVMVGVMAVACSVNNRDDDPLSGSATAAGSMSSSASDTENATSEGSSGSSSSGGEASSGGASSGGAESSGDGTTSDGSTTMPDTAATMTTMNPTTTMGGDVCDEFCNGCACPSDQCTMCCALNDQVDTCQGGMCFCF